MTVSIKWDTDPAQTGRPNMGNPSKQYPPGTGFGKVVITSEQDPNKTKVVTYTLPLEPNGFMSVDKTSINSSGDEAARTISVSGTGFAASSTGTVVLRTGPPGSTGGSAVVTVNVTTNSAGSFAATNLIVPSSQTPGTYHLVGQVGALTSDNTVVMVAATQMSVPANLAADNANITTTQVPLGWDVVTTPVLAQWYTVRYKTSASSTWMTRPVVSTNSITVPGLAPGTAYDFQVKAQATGRADSQYSATVSATTDNS